MHVRRIILLAMLLLAMGPGAAAQALEYSVRGRVTDSATGKPLEAVSVTAEGRYHATVTNADGEFVLKSDSPVTELVLSCLGYRTARVRPGGEDMVQVRLVSDALPLEEALIVTGDPREIVLAAMDRISDNYPTDAELLDCFYRETVRKSQRYVYVCEAVSRLFKTGYGRGVYADRAAVDKSRTLVSRRKRDTLAVKMMGGPTQALSLDVVKNPDVILDKEELRLYRMELDRTVYIDDRPQFVVHLSPAAFSEYALYFGTLYIDRETLAFTRVELSLDMEDIGSVTRMVLVKKPAGLRFTPKEVSLVLNYRTDGGKSRLGYFKSTIRFACDWKKRLLSTNYSVVNELVVTDIREEAVPISREERFRAKEFLSDKAGEFSDPDFWKDYNIIEPTESLEHAIGRLKKRQK